MKFKCLLEILKEKGYIQIQEHKSLGILISITIRSKYHNVIEKIVKNVPDGVVSWKSDRTVTIMTIKDIEEWCRRTIAKDIYHEYETSRTLRSIFDLNEYNCFRKGIEASGKFEVRSCGPHNHMITDLEAKARVEKAKRKEEEEVQNFLDSLP